MLRVGIIGIGSMGENHLKVYKSLSTLCQVGGVFDNNNERALEISKKYNVKHFDTLDGLLKNVDAVSVVVPTEFHYNVGLKCLTHNVHMLMEKPITCTVSQAQDLIQKAKAKGIKLQVGHIELFNPTIKVLKSILMHEEIIAVDIHRLSPLSSRITNNDVITDLMLHDIYILDYLLNTEQNHLYALGQIFDNTIKHAIALIEFKNGVIAQLTSSYKTEAKIRTVRIVTKEAFITADLIDKKIKISRSTNFFKNNCENTYKQKNIIEDVFVPQEEPLKEQLIDFIHCINNDTKPTVNAEDGLKALALSSKIKDFIMENKM